MKLLLVAINARFSHSNPAIYSLKNNLLPSLESVNYPLEVIPLEFNINQQTEYILGEIYRYKAQIVGFSCYIWNRNEVLQIANNLKKISPGTTVILGGPEASSTAAGILTDNPGIDFIFQGEAELSLPRWVRSLKAGDFAEVPGLAYRFDNGEIKINPLGSDNQPDLKLLAPLYTDADLELIKDKIIYYESSRGCPYHCGYCLSSATHGIRYLPIERVKAELIQIINSGAELVKFVDRTFNCHKQRALELWSFLINQTPVNTHFHFEIGAHLLDEDSFAILAQAPVGKFQFEIGVQSTNPQVLAAVGREDQTPRIALAVQRLSQIGKIHLHLDLIAGLPLEDWTSFHRSFDEVYRMWPHRIQLGFLKLLPGTPLGNDAQRWGLKYQSEPPYEVLETPQLPYTDLWQLKRIEELVEVYTNTGRFSRSIPHLVKREYAGSAFAFYHDLAKYWVQEGLYQRKHKSGFYFDLLYQFLESKGLVTQEILYRLKLDYALSEQHNELPPWAPGETSLEEVRSRHHRLLHNQEFMEKYLPHLTTSNGRENIKKTRLVEVVLSNSEKEWLLIDYSQINSVTGLPLTIPVEDQYRQ